MERRQKKETKINELSDNDKSSYRMIISKLENISGKAKGSKSLITEESLTELESIVVELLSMKDRHQRYFIRWLRQGYMDS